MVYFPPHLDSFFALPCETDKHKNCIFSLKSCILLHEIQPIAACFLQSAIWLETTRMLNIANV